MSQTSGDAVRPAVRDRRARPLRDLRISVTDRCNFRCGYCMPRDDFGPDHAFLPRSELLSYEERARLVRVFADLGVSKVRLTGGEPLPRRDLTVLVSLVGRMVEACVRRDGSPCCIGGSARRRGYASPLEDPADRGSSGAMTELQ
jgi:hypothetical protein